MFQLTKNLKLLITAVMVFTSFGLQAQASETNNYQGHAPKYIFYFIGDGMGLSQANATEAYLGAMAKCNGIEKLAFSKFPNQGFYTTYATNRFITGSAAAGTALSTGHKTSINTIGMDANKQIPYKNIAEMARDKGYKVGIVSSVSIDHATPATFYAHQPTRNLYYKISLDLSKSGFNYFAGGGFKHPQGDGKINDKNTMANFGMGNSDQIKEKKTNSMDIAISKGYRIVNSLNDFRALKKGDDKIIAIAPDLAGGKALPYAIDQDSLVDISLGEFTQKGIELLDNPNGFFMMVEGGKIDWACHANDAATVVKEVLQFNNAVSKAIAFYSQHPNETLILVAGDHETGGMALGFSGSHYDSEFALLQYQNISYENFTKIMNTYRIDNRGHYKFQEALALAKTHFGLGDPAKGLELTKFEMQQMQDAFKQSMKKKPNKKNKDQYYLLYGSYDPFTTTLCHILSQKAGIGWTSFSHTATPIPVRAMGVGANLYNGFFDNTDIPKKLMKLIENKL